MDITNLQLNYSSNSSQLVQSSYMPDSYGQEGEATNVIDPGSLPGQRIQSVGYYQFSEQLDLKVKNKDGDTLQVSYDFQGEVAMAQVGNGENLEAAHGNFVNFFDQIKKYIEDQEQKLFDFLVNHSGFFGESSETADIFNLNAPSSNLNIPEYWNAENTSQRIVDFATSFFSDSNGNVNEFGKKIIEAIKKGFEQAAEILGPMPGPVGDLIKDTQKLTFEKLDNWIAQQSAQDTLV